MSIEARLTELGLSLPAAPIAVGAYVPVLQTGHLVVTSGQLPMEAGVLNLKGKVGANLSVEDGVRAARIATLNAIAQIKAQIGDLDRVVRIVRVEGFVNSAPGFTAQPQVLNGASNLLLDIFGDLGRHTRFAVGASELPLDAAVEVAVWAEVR